MTCRNQIGQLNIKLDNRDRIVDFSLNKYDCTLPPGGLTILPYIKERSAEEILHGRLDKFVPKKYKKMSPDGPVKLLMENQFAAVTIVLAIYLGKEQDEAETPFTVQSIEHGPEGTNITGYITLRSTWQEVLGCGRCRGTHHRKSLTG